ncbi:hypothetical protein BT96DRAFT_997419 [Gymnopus androsaceus JB14]|uniref:Uncharacterized protein n=1 Tax=Gymnopus androsaceus JB14 TaxID=1447944 RepID=A0A6A4HF51_9AGAR|nr:hypothetical protein BT96DRAFT_997419 [Gymnopus androsaceus JB14]
MDSAVALIIFASYFLIIITLFGIVLNELLQKYGLHRDSFSRKRATLFAFLAVVSFAHTWYYMFRFMEWSFRDYESKVGAYDGSFIERLGNWLVGTALFEQAWRTVCYGASNWWWSQQLCSYTVGSWTIFIFVEGNRRNIRHVWAYMFLGQLVAISVASNLFYVAISLSAARPVKQVAFHPVVSCSVLLSLLAVACTPLTSEHTFLPNLLLMHTLAMVPLLCGPYLDAFKDFSMNVRLLHTQVLFISVCIHVSSSLIVFFSSDQPVAAVLWSTLFSHPAQSSIGWDVIWTSASFVLWSILTNQTSTRRGIVSLMLTPLVSVGVVAPVVALVDEESRLIRKTE